jgi:hypothetical protein
MIQTVNEFMFRDAFQEIRPDNFSYAGLGALFEGLEQYEDIQDEPIELDVIALCCDFTEYEHIGEFWLDYGQEEYPDMESIENSTEVFYIKEKLDIASMKYIVSEGFIIRQF